eukprot:3801572-Amphidinium_carterae.1
MDRAGELVGPSGQSSGKSAYSPGKVWDQKSPAGDAWTQQRLHARGSVDSPNCLACGATGTLWHQRNAQLGNLAVPYGELLRYAAYAYGPVALLPASDSQ